jgi:hypothetical protein
MKAYLVNFDNPDKPVAWAGDAKDLERKRSRHQEALVGYDVVLSGSDRPQASLAESLIKMNRITHRYNPSTRSIESISLSEIEDTRKERDLSSSAFGALIEVLSVSDPSLRDKVKARMQVRGA